LLRSVIWVLLQLMHAVTFQLPGAQIAASVWRLYWLSGFF